MLCDHSKAGRGLDIQYVLSLARGMQVQVLKGVVEYINMWHTCVIDKQWYGKIWLPCLNECFYYDAR